MNKITNWVFLAVFLGQSLSYAGPLHNAAKTGNLDQLKAFLKPESVDVLDLCDFQRTALIIAAMHGQLAIVQELLTAGAKIDIEDTYGKNALIYAAKNGHLAIIQKLLTAWTQAGMKVTNIKDRYEITVLMHAAEGGHLAVVQELLKAGVDVNAHSGNGRTALMFAAIHGHLAVICELLEVKNIKVDTQNTYDRQTALISAAACGQLAVVEKLLWFGANPNIKNQYGNSLLFRAYENKKVEVVNYLREWMIENQLTTKDDKDIKILDGGKPGSYKQRYEAYGTKEERQREISRTLENLGCVDCVNIVFEYVGKNSSRR